MITFTNLTGLAGIAILIVTLAVTLLRRLEVSESYLPLIAVVLAVIVCVPIPIGGLPPAAYVRGMIGDISITSVLLLTLTLVKYFTRWQPLSHQEKMVLCSLIVILALVFYPLTFGIGNFDPYRMGFGDIWFLVGLFIITLAAYLKRFYVVALCIAFAVFAWSVGWYEANNAWNYLLDPFVVVYAVGVLSCGAARRLKRLLHRAL